MSSTAVESRIDGLLAEYEAGSTLDEIGEKHGISRQRVHVLLSRSGEYANLVSARYWLPRYEKKARREAYERTRKCATKGCRTSLAFERSNLIHCPQCRRERRLKRMRQYTSQKIASRIQRKLCRCGAKPDKGYRTCTPCREYRNSYYHRSRRRKMEIKRVETGRRGERVSIDREQSSMSREAQRWAYLIQDPVGNTESLDSMIESAREVRLIAGRVERALRRRKSSFDE